MTVDNTSLSCVVKSLLPLMFYTNKDHSTLVVQDDYELNISV